MGTPKTQLAAKFGISASSVKRSVDVIPRDAEHQPGRDQQAFLCLRETGDRARSKSYVGSRGPGRHSQKLKAVGY
jgi:hypothetical protein